jgi:hypothetical protein
MALPVPRGWELNFHAMQSMRAMFAYEQTRQARLGYSHHKRCRA